MIGVLPDQSRNSPSAIERRTRAPLVILAVVCAALAALVHVLAVRTATGQRLDDSAFGNLTRADSRRVFDATEDLLSTISIASVGLLGLAIVAFALTRGRRDLALGAGVLVVGANATTQLLKQSLTRPELGSEPSSVFGSFPSGHVTVAMSLAMALALVSPPAVRPLAATLGAAYAAGVGVAVLALNWHRPSDVIGAYLVATTWAALVGAFTRSERPDRAGSTGTERVVAVAGGALVLAFLAVSATAAAQRVDLLTIVDDRSAFVAASAVVTVVALVVMTIFLRLLRGGLGESLP